MSWTQVLAQWPNLLTDLAADFIHLDVTALRRFRGDRSKMNRYLAQTHDLTIAEAAEVLDDWFAFKAPRLTRQLAA